MKMNELKKVLQLRIKYLYNHQLPHCNYSENNIHKSLTLTEINTLKSILDML